MIDLDIFGRGEIKRLSYELRHEQLRHQETKREVQYLRGVKTSQAATVDMLMQELRAADELIRQLKATEQKLFQMYKASEAARQELAQNAQEREALSPSSVACGESFPPGGSQKEEPA